MEKVEIRLIANNQEAVKGVRGLASETDKLGKTEEKQNTKRKGFIEQETQRLKQLKDRRDATYNTGNLETYNRLIADSEKRLAGYHKAGLKANETTQTLTQTIGKWVLGLGVAATALNAVKEAVLSTTVGINAFNIAGAATKQVLYNLVTGASSLTAGLTKAIEAQRMLNELRTKDIIDTFEAKKQQLLYNKYYFEASDQRKKDAERIALYDKALAAHNKMIDTEIANTKEEIAAQKKLVDSQPGNEKYMQRYGELQVKMLDLESQRYEGSKRIESARTGMIQANIEKELKWKEDLHAGLQKMADDFIKERIDRDQKFLDLSQKLIEEYDKSQIESLTGIDKLEAQREFGLKQIAEFRKTMEEMGKLTPEQEKMFEGLAKNVNEAFKTGLQKFKLDPKIMFDFAGKSLEESIKEGQKLQHTYIKTGSDDEGFSIWSLLGIDPDSEEGGEAIKAMEEMVSNVKSAIDDMYEKRVEDAQRNRELLDTRISEEQHALDAEIRLAEKGFASNVQGKKNEIERLKKLRDQALKDEEKAMRAQRAADTIMQTSSLVTAAAHTFKDLPGPLLPLAIIAVGAMFTAFAAAKIKANKLTTKLGKGSHGEVNGRLHSEGGERFNDHIEVEDGEKWGVLSRSASRKYGPVFENMVDAFNKNKLPVPKNHSNNIFVENNGPNSRLDEVNKNLKGLRQGEEVTLLNGYKVIRKGFTTRTVRI